MNKIIMYDSDEAASFQNISCWVSHDGGITRDEHLARLWGCTHRQCKCGEVYHKSLGNQCSACDIKERIARYDTFPTREYNGGPVGVYSQVKGDREYLEEFLIWNEEQLRNYVINTGRSLESLKLVHTESLGIPELSADDIYTDYTWEGWDPDELPDTVHDAIRRLNEAMELAGPQGYLYTDVAVTFSQEMKDRLNGKE